MAKAKDDGGIVETIKTVVYALLLAGIFRTLFFQPFYIPSGSMKSTLLIGDFLFVNKMAYGYSAVSCPLGLCPFIEGRILGSEPERGDIVVFRHPTNGTDYIKRLIGVPGDEVQVVDGRLFLNGEIVPRDPDGVFTEINEPQGPERRRPSCSNRVVSIGAECLKNRFVETLPNGVSYTMLDTTTVSSDNTPPIRVPEGQYFFMGDNRDNSIDSRVSRRAGGVGFVPYENLIGRANHVVFSSGGSSMFAVWAWRLDRFFVGLD
ncbi:MAG: signal peptidase I [Pseudomonadota bacterium]